MSTATTQTTPSAEGLTTGVIVARIRRFVVMVLVSGGIYATLTHGSRGRCGIVDEVTGIAECVTLQLRPSPLILLAFVGIVLWALTGVRRRLADPAAAVAYLRHAGVVAMTIAGASVVLAMFGFFLAPSDGSTAFSPFPFGSVETRIEPSAP